MKLIRFEVDPQILQVKDIQEFKRVFAQVAQFECVRYVCKHHICWVYAQLINIDFFTIVTFSLCIFHSLFRWCTAPLLQANIKEF
jgi:hypothetical protein